MEELALNEALYNDIVIWMANKYALTTQWNRMYFLKKIFKEHRVLNLQTLKLIMMKVKYQHQRSALVMINNYCYDNNINFNIRIPSVKKQATKIPDILSTAEVDLLVQSAPKPYDLVIRCIINFGAGLRVSEIIKLSWDHIRWIDWLGNQESYGVVSIKSGKGMKDRIVNIPNKLMKDLYNYAKEQNVLNEFRVPTGGMIFEFGSFSKNKTNELLELDQEKLKAHYVQAKYDWFRYNIVRKHCEKALNKKVKIHGLRHYRATYLHEYENVPIEDLQILLGHTSLNTTMIYTKVNPRSVFEKLKHTKEV